MLYVMLRQRIVERCTDPTSPDYKKVIKMTSKPVEEFVSYNLDIIPRIGETIRLSENAAYDVISVVHSRRYSMGICHPEIIAEVVPHVVEHNFDTGGYSFKEEWPLISDLELEEG